MKRKNFIKTTAAFTAGSMLMPAWSCKEESKAMVPQPHRTNWAGNLEYQADYLYEPQSAEEVQALIRKLDSQKALGSKHCFNDIADSPLNQISTRKLVQPLKIDTRAMTVTVGAGSRYGDIAPELHAKGYALHNLASLPHISIGGACATATHGSGIENGNLATAIAGMQLVSGNGTILDLHRDKDSNVLDAMAVHLGALGIITNITLGIQNTFEIRQHVYQNLPFEELTGNFREIMSAGYSVSLFTDWQDQKVSQVWVKRRTDREHKEPDSQFYGAKAAEKDLHPITRLSAENCTPQMGVPGPWYERLPHFKMGFTPGSGEELQSEFFVPFENAVHAIQALEKKREAIFPHLFISEIRSIAADTLWMSPCYQQDCIAIHFTWKQHPKEVGDLITMIEAELNPYGAKPHWGKLFNMSSAILKSRYPKYSQFRDLALTHDPEGKFKNDFLARTIYTN